MGKLKNLWTLYKSYSKELNFIKIVVLLIVNTWLLIILWKIFILEGVNIGENNIVLKKTESILKPVLMYLGIDILTPSTIKMLLVSSLIIMTNITVLHFNAVALLGVSLGMARYGYKMYTNYLINKENILKIYLKKEEILPEIKKIPKVLEQAPIVINNVTEGTNWWLWGTVIVVGVIAIAGIGLAIWSHNTNVNNIVESSEASLNLSSALDTKINSLNQKTTHINNQVDLIFNNHGKSLQALENKDNLLNQKITNLENSYQDFGLKISKLEENNLANIKLLSEQTLEISREAKTFFGEVLETSSASEAMVLTMTKLYEGYTTLCERMDTTEVRLNSIAGSSTPRSTINTNLFKNVVRKDDEI